MSRIDLQYFDGVNAIVAPNVSKRAELYHSENSRSPLIGTIEKRAGSEVIGTAAGGGVFTAVSNYGLFYFSSAGANNTGLYRISKVGTTTSVYYLKSNNEWTPLAGLGTTLLAGTMPTVVNGHFDTTIAENNLFFVNYENNNRYIKGSDGTTVVDSTDTTGHLYNSPKGSIINYYKNHLYIADYLQGTTRFKTSVVKSSAPCGIVALVASDPVSPFTSVELTTIKYIYTTAPGNTLDVYRGNTKIGVYTVTSINNTTIAGTMAFEIGQIAILSADELWVPGSFNGPKVFRWSYNPGATGISVKEYDTFKLPGQDNEEIKMMCNVSNMMLISNNSSLAVWNDYVLQTFDSGIGCVSKTGWVKNLGVVYFLHYSGIYSTAGGAPQLISSKMEPYIAGATRAGLESCAAGRKEKSVFFIIGDTTLYNLDGSIKKTLNDTVLEYSITQENWFIHTGIKASEFTSWVSSLDVDICVFTSTGTNMQTTEFLKAGTTTDDNVEIHWRADTSNICLNSSFENLSYVQEIILEAHRGSQIKCFVSLDFGQFYEIEGEAAKGCTIFKVTSENGDSTKPPRCRNISISWRDSSRQKVAVSKASIVYSTTLENEPQRLDYNT